jgi:acyl carrier protein
LIENRMPETVKSREEILAHLREVLVELFELKPEQVVLDAHLYNDLDIDSIDAVDLILRLKEFTGKKIQPQSFKHVRTVRDVVEAIYTLMNDTPAAS